jgi:hypothetical protein
MQWIVVTVIIVIAVVSAIAQTIKNQQEKEQTPRRRSTRPRQSGEGVRTGASDMDRFLQEIEKLRKRSAEGGGEEPKKPQKAKPGKPVPTVVPVKRKRTDPVPTVSPARVDRLPTATVLNVPPPMPSLPTPPEPSPITTPLPTDSPVVSRRPQPVGTTPFAKGLLGLLSQKQSLPMAVVLVEVLGPPKCQQQQR